MNNNLEKIKLLCKNNYDFTGHITDEYLFTINCVDYFYYGKDIGAVAINDGFIDGALDGGIDFIYNDAEKVYFIQGKSTETLNYEEIRNLYCKMSETLGELKRKKYDNYNKKLVNRYIDVMDMLDNPDICLVLFTNSIISDKDRSRIYSLSNDPAFENYTLVCYDKDDIEAQELNVDDTNMSISEGKLLLDGANNSLKYGDGRGAIFSIKASSLKDLYLKYSKNGLFGYNLREHIIQKSVDNAIDKTILTDKDNFWFYNNGITIGCSDYNPSGNTLKLYDFSIINGAQTTTKIGNSNYVNENNDFSIVCKVIKSEKSLDDEFIRKVSEASNSQKPIRPRDLKSNSNEQKKLQAKSMDCKYPLSIEIKRGVRPKNYRKVLNPWQRVNNEYIGQILLACEYLQPGTARSNKADIFGKDETYNLLFSKDKVKNYSYEAIYDFVKIGNIYDEFKLRYIKEGYDAINSGTLNEGEIKNKSNKISICSNAKFFVLSIICFFYKTQKLNIKSLTDEKLYEPNIIGIFTLGYNEEDYFERLEYLFEFIIDKLSDIYDKNQSLLKVSSHSNFLKTNKIYREVILPAFNSLLADKYDREKIIDNLKIFN